MKMIRRAVAHVFVLSGGFCLAQENPWNDDWTPSKTNLPGQEYSRMAERPA
jgi:hypothetical protein